jgi:16S rRNA (guanine527-N7)-methyltransferase
LARASVFGGRVETVPVAQAAVISARAYAPLPRLLESAVHLSTEKTVWVLPKGRNAQNELEAASRSWQGVFHVERSVTDADSAIIVAHAVKSVRRKARG